LTISPIAFLIGNSSKKGFFLVECYRTPRNTIRSACFGGGQIQENRAKNAIPVVALDFLAQFLMFKQSVNKTMMILSQEEKLKLMRNLNWDYLDTHEDMLAVIEGRLETS
jgi:hypothetical protein